MGASSVAEGEAVVVAKGGCGVVGFGTWMMLSLFVEDETVFYVQVASYL